MACKLAALLALAGGPAVAQLPGRTNPAAPQTASGQVIRAQKPADSITPVSAATPPLPVAIPAAPTGSYAHQVDKKKLQDDKSFEEKDKENRLKYVKFPPREDVFSLPNDARLQEVILERLRQEERDAGKDPYGKYPMGLAFPKVPIVGGGLPYASKTPTYPPSRINYEPLYVIHRRLHFEEKNAERYGWDLGIIQPLVSAAYFYKDILLWPNSLASGCAYGFWSTDAGKCLPGSPTPYMLYPPGLTITGTVVEGVIITGVGFAIP